MHERILGKLIDDPSVRLAHWDWDTPSRNLIPPAFKVGSLDDPLRRSMLDAPIPASLVGTAAMDAAMRPMTFTGFGGGMSNAGSLEMNPHVPVHCWTSCDAPNCCQPNMGVLATAARDPIFYAHHSNIDRLWAVWLAQGGGRSNPSDPSWLDMQWTFFDENKVWTSISVRDVLDYESNLGYSYECLEYSSEHCETGGMRTLDVVELAAEPIRMTAEPETASVSMPAHFKAAAAAAVAAPRPERIHYLHIDGIHVPSHKAALLRVFANAPDATAETDIDTPNFLGYISAVAKVESSDEGHDHGKFNAVLDMTHFSIELFAADDFYVTLVPVGLSGSDDAVAHDVTYERIYLTNE
jgi:polyphenol oxidase